MMRKTSLILLSAAAGAAVTLFVTQPRSVLMGSSARAATSDTYRQLNLFGDVFERVRSDYVEKPDDSKLVESAISGMLIRIRATWTPRASATCRCRPAANLAGSASK
jgi:carboxyl-terminal processing protease